MQSINRYTRREREWRKMEKKTIIISETFQKQNVHVEHGEIIELEHETKLQLPLVSTPMPNSCQSVR